MEPAVMSTKTRACEHFHRRSIILDTYTHPDKITDQPKLPVTLDEDDLFNDLWDTLPKCLQDELVNEVKILEENAKKANSEHISIHTLRDEAVDHGCKLSTSASVNHGNLQSISNDQDYVTQNALRAQGTSRTADRATVFTPKHTYRRGISRLIDRDNDRDDNDRDDNETAELRGVSPPPSPLLLSSGSPDRIFVEANIPTLGFNNFGDSNNTPNFRGAHRTYTSGSSVNQISYSRLNETSQHDKLTTPVYRTFAQCGKRKFIDMCIDEQQSTTALDENARPLEKIYDRDREVTGHCRQHYSDGLIGHDDLSEDVQWSPSLETPERPSANGTNSASPGSIMQSLRDSAAEQMRAFGAGPSDSPSEHDPIGSDNDQSNIMKWPHSQLSEFEDDEMRQTSFEGGSSSDGNHVQQMETKSRTVPLSDIDIPDEKQKVPTNFLFDRSSDLRASRHTASPPSQSNLHFGRSYFQYEYPGSPSLRKGYQEGVRDGCGSKDDRREPEKSSLSPQPLSSLANMPVLLRPETSPMANSIPRRPWSQSLIRHKRVQNDDAADDKENKIAIESEDKIERMTARVSERKNFTDSNALAANPLSPVNPKLQQGTRTNSASLKFRASLKYQNIQSLTSSPVTNLAESMPKGWNSEVTHSSESIVHTDLEEITNEKPVKGLSTSPNTEGVCEQDGVVDRRSTTEDRGTIDEQTQANQFNGLCKEGLYIKENNENQSNDASSAIKLTPSVANELTSYTKMTAAETVDLVELQNGASISLPPEHSDDVIKRSPLLQKMDQTDFNGNENENEDLDDFDDDFDFDSLDQIHKATQELLQPSSVHKQTYTNTPKTKEGEIGVDLNDDLAKLDPMELISRVNNLTSVYGGFQTGRQQGINVQISTKTVSEMFKTLESTTSSHNDLEGPFGDHTQNTTSDSTSDSTSRGNGAVVNRLSRPMTLKMMAKEAHRTKNSMKNIEFNALMTDRNTHVDAVVATSRSEVKLAKLADLTNHHSRPLLPSDDSVLESAAHVSAPPSKTPACEVLSHFPSTTCEQTAAIDAYLDIETAIMPSKVTEMQQQLGKSTIDNDEIMALNTTLGRYGGFTTANGKKATAISTKALCDAFTIFSRDSPGDKSITTDRIFSPQTATKTQVADSIECSTPIITKSGHQMDEMDTLTSDVCFGISNDTTKPPRHLEITTARDPLPNRPTVRKFNGFATASGKAVPAISAGRLKEAQAKLLDSCDLDFMEFPQTENLSDSARIQLDVNLDPVPTYVQSTEFELAYNRAGVMTTSNEMKSQSMQLSKQTSIGIYKQDDCNHSSDKTFTIGGASLSATPEKPEPLSTDLCHNGMRISKTVPMTNRTRISEIPADLHRNPDLVSSSISNFNTSKATSSGSLMDGFAHQLRSIEVTKSNRTPHLTSTSLRRRTNLNPLDGSLAGGKASTSPAIRLRSSPSALKSSRYRPFRSPLRSDRMIARPVETTEANGSVNVFKAASLIKMTTLFDLTTIGNRQKLGALVTRRPLELDEKELLLMHISMDVVHMTSSLAQYFHFGCWGSVEARGAILDIGALPQYATPNWVNNHYRWIVWKLACMVRNFPEHYSEWWCASKVIEQLRYRYEREINHAHRSAIKRIVEQDDTASKHMVLCVADILDDNHKTEVKGDISNAIECDSKARSILELTDGWYRIFATVDKALQRAIVKGKIKIGSKLSICGAQLSGSMEPIPVLEISMSKLLTISANGAKLVSWDTTLGYQKQPIVSRSLSSLCCDGGLIPLVDVVIMRKYPLAFNEILSDGSIVTRTAREEELAEREHEAYKEKQLELIIAEVERKMSQTRRTSSQPIIEHDFLQDLNVEGQDEKAFYESLISKQEEKRAEMDQKINEQINERRLDRKISAFFKVKLCDYPKHGGPRKPCEATLIIRNANASQFDELHEGRRYHIYTLTALAKQDRIARADVPWTENLWLKTTPKTRWQEIDLTEGMLESSMYYPRIILPCDRLSEKKRGDEVDLAVIVLNIASPIKSQAYGRSSFKQTMLVADATEQMVQIEFNKLTRGIQNSCKNGVILGIQNLRYSLYDPRYAIHTLKASDDMELYQANSTCRVTYVASAIEELDCWIKAEPNRLKNLKERAAVLTGQLTPIL